MFDIKDYTYLDCYKGVSIGCRIDKEKISKDVEQLKEILLNLENLIGPFKIKVINGKVKLKTKDDF